MLLTSSVFSMYVYSALVHAVSCDAFMLLLLSSHLSSMLRCAGRNQASYLGHRYSLKKASVQCTVALSYMIIRLQHSTVAVATR